MESETARAKKKPMSLLQAFGYSVAITAAMVSCMAIRDYGESKRSSPEYMAREQKRAAEEAAAATKKAEEAVRSCAKDDIAAFVMTQEHVRASLKAPPTAKFPSITTPGVKTVYLGNCTHEVRAFVDAQNSFGAMLRTRYMARMRKDPATDDWYLVEIQIANQ